MTNEQLKPIIDEILKNYFNRATRLGYNTRTQEIMIAQNRGLCNACSSVITFSDNEGELVEYTKQKVKEVNQGEAQEIIIE